MQLASNPVDQAFPFAYPVYYSIARHEGVEVADQHVSEGKGRFAKILSFLNPKSEEVESLRSKLRASFLSNVLPGVRGTTGG